jgi:hypothetical protein
MAKLPNLENAVLRPEKIVNYLLAVDHPQGRSKARFFTQFGFSLDEWEALGAALHLHAFQWDVIETVENQFGKKYIVEGPISTPSGRRPNIRAVWFIGNGSEVPEFVTAFPGKEPRK